MAYVTEAQLIDRYGEQMLVALTDRGPVATGIIDSAIVAEAIAAAEAVIDGYLAARYALPLTVAQPILTDVALAIAIWRLHRHQADPKIEADYKAAMQMLREIAAGTVRLNAAGVEAAGSGGTGVQVTDRERPFSEENLKGFI